MLLSISISLLFLLWAGTPVPARQCLRAGQGARLGLGHRGQRARWHVGARATLGAATYPPSHATPDRPTYPSLLPLARQAAFSAAGESRAGLGGAGGRAGLRRGGETGARRGAEHGAGEELGAAAAATPFSLRSPCTHAETLNYFQVWTT